MAERELTAEEMAELESNTPGFSWERAWEREREARNRIEAQLSRMKKREVELMRTVLDAEKFDRKYGLQLPGDSALNALFLSFEEYLAVQSKRLEETT